MDEIVADPQEEKGVPAVDEPKVEAKAEEPSAKVDGIDEIKRQLAAEKQARVDAERRAHEAQVVASRSRNEVDDTNLRLVENAIGALKHEADGLEQQYAAAMADQNFAHAAKIQRAMASNEAKLLQLESGREAMAARPKHQPPAPAVGDPVEAFASKLAGPSAAWIRAHPEYVTDQRLFRKMARAHEDAVDEGVRPDSPAYFAHVERALGIGADGEDSEDEGVSEAARPVARRSSPPAAPVSRSSGTNGGRPRVIRLTAEEAEVAKLTGMTEQQYWENKQALNREGRLN